MSEKLLESLMHLFAILARDGGITKEETEVVRAFLYQQLNQAAADQYLRKFEALANSTAQETLDDIAQRVNRELTQKQKIIVLIRLIELINADKSISDAEQQAIQLVATTFHIDTEEYNEIFRFVNSDEPQHLYYDPNVLRIGHPIEGVPADIHHIVVEGYPGYISVLCVRSVEAYILKYSGSGDVYVNGLLIRPQQVYFLAPGSVIRHQKHHPVYYSDIVTRFLSDKEKTKTVFEAREIIYRFPSGKVGLHNINIFEESGRMIGLMGGSGAGKSTLLNVLNGNYVPTQGSVNINGIDINKDKKAIEGVIGYVSQDDLLMEDLTVYQNLFYNAKLCFANKSEEELDKMVMRVLMDLGLAETKDLKVGNPLQKTISGGQRKRLNIALELIREPSVLFVDEPTSGLSSRDSENIMDLLKELALRGKLVFVVIHQPSSDIFKMFDKLYILDVGGYPIYYGNPVEAVSYFKRQADLINSEYAECAECGNVNPEQIFNIIESKVLDENGNFTNQRKYSPLQWNEAFTKHIALPKVSATNDKPESNLNIPSKLNQIGVFIKRDVLSKLANKSYMYINFLEAPLLALILAFILRYFNADPSNVEGYTLFENLNLPAYLFICILVALFMGLTVSAEEILRDRRILKREAFLNLSRSSYLISKVIILFAISAIQAFTFVIIGNWIMGIEGMNMAYWFTLFTVSCFANMLGMNVSATFDNAVTIYILVPILLIPQIILSGVIVKFEKLNPALAAHGTVPLVGDLMASRWAYEGLAVYQFKENGYESQFYSMDKNMSVAQYKQNFWIKKLDSKVGYCMDNLAKPELKEQVSYELALIRAELEQEVKNFVMAEDPKPLLAEIEYEKFNEETGKKVRALLSSINSLYVQKYRKANDRRDQVMASLQPGPDGKDPFYALKMRHHNESLSDLVTNRTDDNKILELDGQLVQAVDPVFHDARHGGLLNYRAHFFSPNKRFLGVLHDTFWFNMGVIWLMSALLYLTLYVEGFRKMLDAISKRIGKKKSQG